MNSTIYWIIACVVAGWLTGLIMKGRGYGLIGDFILGIVGGWLAGLLLTRFIHVGNGMTGQILIRMLGAVLLVLIVRLLRRA
ncbi:MAG: GlsB/YeaQ/YmgE family stress response membrane protein [Thermoanaerobaculia bacterium]